MLMGVFLFLMGYILGSNKRKSQLEPEWHSLREQLASAKASADAHETIARKTDEFHQRSLHFLQENHDRAMVKMRDAFRAMTQEAILSAQPELTGITQSQIKAFQDINSKEFSLRQKSIEASIKPLEARIEAFVQSLQDNSEKISHLSNTSNKLSADTSLLARVLHSNQSRGIWGEMTLRRLLDDAGLSVHCDFAEQPTAPDQKSRPDLILRLPENRCLLVDSKFPLPNWSQDDFWTNSLARSNELKNFSAKVRLTIRELSKKNYPTSFPGAFECTILFFPAESLLSWVLEADPDLLSWAQKMKIFCCSPANLIAMFHIVNALWKVDSQTRNAARIAAEAKTIVGEISRFMASLEDVGKHIEKSQCAFNSAMSRIDSTLKSPIQFLQQIGIAEDTSTVKSSGSQPQPKASESSVDDAL